MMEAEQAERDMLAGFRAGEQVVECPACGSRFPPARLPKQAVEKIPQRVTEDHDG